MNVAFIGPKTAFDYLLETYYHLALPWTIEWYREIVDPDAFIILDNGAAEGRAVGGGRLVALADKYKVNEIVLPDRIGDKKATTREVKQFMRTYGEVTKHLSKMGVVQGETMDEFQRCAETLIDQGVTTIGVPRHMNETLFNKWGRVDFLRWFFEEFGQRIQVHCLGASRWVTEARVLSEFPVRGIDTSLPVVAALEHKPIQTLTTRLDRRQDFFQSEFDMAAVGYLTTNQLQFLRWSNGTQ